MAATASDAGRTSREAGRRWLCGTRSVDLARPAVMGIVNLTTDSFSDGGRFLDRTAAIAQAERLVGEGADILDLGAESTRPGAGPVPAGIELARLLPVLQAVRGFGVPVSIDTSKPTVMRACLDAGADAINDIRGFDSPEARAAVRSSHCGLVVMHMQGEPGTMQLAPAYRDVVEEVDHWLDAQACRLEIDGIERERIVVDPGFGFGKDAGHNLALLRALDRLASRGRPVLAGLSRKRVIAQWSGRPDSQPDERIAASVAAALLAVQHGARLVRVHDVRATVDALRVWQATFADPRPIG